MWSCGRRAAVVHVLVRELHMPIDVLQPGRLAKADELVVDEAILDVVELVHVLHNGLTIILYKVLDKSISADGNSKTNVAVNHKRRGRDQGTEVRGKGIGNEHALCGSVRISRRNTLDENLGLVIEDQASILLESLVPPSLLLLFFRAESTSSATDIISVRYSAGVLVVLGEGPAPEVMNRETKHEPLRAFTLEDSRAA
jgi:hypothetical protein